MKELDRLSTVDELSKVIYCIPTYKAQQFDGIPTAAIKVCKMHSVVASLQIVMLV